MRIERPERTFIDNNLKIDSWDVLKPYFDDLLQRNIDVKVDFEKWLKDLSEVDAVLEENLAWRYIKMTINTKDEDLTKSYQFFINEIQPKLSPIENELNLKLVASPFVEELSSNEAYQIFFRKIKTSLDLFREENIPLQSDIANESQKFGALSAQQSIEHDGKTLTMQQAAVLLKEQDEDLRKLVFDKIANRRRQDFKAFDDLFNSLLKKRHQVATNAGFKNFRDYKMKAMGRFDYSIDDCRDFHKSIKELIVPIVKSIQEKRLQKLGKDQFKPWDLDVDPEGKKALKPFEKSEELIDGTIKMFNELDPYFGDCIATMNTMHHLDLESKDGKAPGGYNYPLFEIGVPFIFMNAVGSQRDLVTMVHEGGHAVHSFLSRNLPITGFKNLPSEVAELASMSMELLSMEKWNEFYQIDDNFNRAKKEQLEGILKVLPWIAQVDEFQHWLYENFDHTNEERTQKWQELNKEYGTGLTDWSGYEDIIDSSWQRQLHIFEVPFYYIEYGIAQLGALQVWRNYLTDKSKAIEDYKSALKLGYTRSIPSIYKTANIEFNFKKDAIVSLSNFIETELSQLN